MRQELKSKEFIAESTGTNADFTILLNNHGAIFQNSKDKSSRKINKTMHSVTYSIGLPYA